MNPPVSPQPTEKSMNRPVSFALHIAPLFTSDQRACMIHKFDLAKYADVKAHGPKILQRITDGSMPADDSNPWPDEWTALFKRWIDEGFAV
jgi:hypothetical protein